MCRFYYSEYKSCGCELYEARGVIKLCVARSHWFPTVVIRRTDETGDLDFFYRRQRFVTVAKNSRKNKLPWLPCKEHKYTCHETFVDRQRDPCPWHDDMVKKWELMNQRGDRDGARTEQHPKPKGGLLRTVKAAVTRGGGK